MNIAQALNAVPSIMVPSVRMMRQATSDNSEFGTDWAPELLPLKVEHPEVPGLYLDQQSPSEGLYSAIIRPGYEGHPLGVVVGTGNMSYTLLNHREDTAMVAGCGADVKHAGAVIDGHGFRIINRFRVSHTESEVTLSGTKLALRDFLLLSHNHTGDGSVQMALVTYLGTACLGARIAVRKIHKSAGTDANGVKLTGNGRGVGGKSGWGDIVGSILNDSLFLQDYILEAVRRAAETPVSDEHAATLNKWFDKTYRVPEDRAKREMNVLRQVCAYHETQRGPMKWGVWSRRMQADGILGMFECLGIQPTRTAKV